MKRPTTVRVITRDLYDAVLFDLDGVITDTASFHATCWKQMFDEYLQNRARERGEPFKPFDVTTDYLHYVDGKQRSDGVRDFLKSRGIALPERSAETNHPPTRGVDLETLRVAAYQGSVKLIQQLRHQGFKLAVVTSGQNCAAILEAVKPDALFEVRIDGGMIPSQHLAGKPAPIHF